MIPAAYDEQFDDAIRATFTRAAAGLRPAPGTAERVRRRHRRHRRWQAAGVSALTAAAVGVGVLVVAPRSNQGATQLTPAGATTSSPTPGPGPALGAGRTLGGVELTYLPAGMSLAGSGEQAYGQPAVVEYSSTFRGPQKPHPHELTVGVSWGPNSMTLDQSEAALRKFRFSMTPVTIRGHSAWLSVLPAQSGLMLTWIEQPGLQVDLRLLGIEGSGANGFAAARDAAEHVAAGMVVRGRPILATSPAEGVIRNAFADAFNAGVPPARALAAIQDGPKIGAGRERYLERWPGLARSRQVTVNLVVPLDPTHALVGFTENFQEPGLAAQWPDQITTMADGRQTLGGSGQAVWTGGRWKVSQLTYCAAPPGVCG